VITDVAGIRVGHRTDTTARTGCTVVLPPAGTVASGEIRGGAPAERDFALLAPERSVQHVDAVVLSGGSAFGLAAADGAMRWCEERGIGLETPAGRVPIVVGLSIFDLVTGDPAVRPTPDDAYAACEAATDEPPETGTVGAGTGATVANALTPDNPKPGGVGSASLRSGDLVVGALAVVNAFGDRLEPDVDKRPAFDESPYLPFGTNTTVAVVATNARLDKAGCLLVAQSAHDGFARALEPAHTAMDGDAAVALATGATDAPLEVVRLLAARAVEQAIRQPLG